MERDKRERDARERELRERELREMEMREKFKAELEMKPPGTPGSKIREFIPCIVSFFSSMVYNHLAII